MNGSEAGGDLALIQTSQLFPCKYTQLALEQLDLHNKSSEVCIKTRSPQASLPFRGQVTEQTTQKRHQTPLFKRDLKYFSPLTEVPVLIITDYSYHFYFFFFFQLNT